MVWFLAPALIKGFSRFWVEHPCLQTSEAGEGRARDSLQKAGARTKGPWKTSLIPLGACFPSRGGGGQPTEMEADPKKLCLLSC